MPSVIPHKTIKINRCVSCGIFVVSVATCRITYLLSPVIRSRRLYLAVNCSASEHTLDAHSTHGHHQRSRYHWAKSSATFRGKVTLPFLKWSGDLPTKGHTTRFQWSWSVSFSGSSMDCGIQRRAEAEGLSRGSSSSLKPTRQT